MKFQYTEPYLTLHKSDSLASSKSADTAIS